MKAALIYVEIDIAVDIDTVWRLTQDTDPPERLKPMRHELRE